MSVVVAVDGREGAALAERLRDAGREVTAVPAPGPAVAAADATARPDTAQLMAELSRAEVLVVGAGRATLTAALVAACDRFGVRIVAVCGRDADRRLAASFGLGCCGPDASAQQLWAAAGEPAGAGAPGRIIAVWGAAGAPGRTRLAIELACELARDGRRVGLVDADSHAPSVALVTGLADEGPGFAAACRQAERGALTAAELSRVAVPLGGVEVLTGINRPGRWPELSAPRVRAALLTCRAWAEDVVVDVAASLERDEEIVSDLDGPRRNAATLAVLEEADVVVAVLTPDPTGVSRFVRAYGELRSAAPAAAVHVVVNKARPQVVGIDVRGQLARVLSRYCGIDRFWMVPWDAKACDAAVLAAQPVARVRGRSGLAGAVRRLVGEAIDPPVPARRALTRTRSARAA